MSTLIPQIKFPEIIIGLVAPIGSEVSQTVEELTTAFSNIDYNVINIRVTKSFEKLEGIVSPETPLNETNILERYRTFIGYGNQIREHCGDNSILAAIAVQQVTEMRTAKKLDFVKNLFILHQFKRPEEIELLRSVYGRNFFQISVYSRRDARVDILARKISEDKKEANHDKHRSEAEELVHVDENQSKLQYGQRVGKIFHDADFIVNSDVVEPSVSGQVDRFCELLFSSNSVTPTKIEYGMFAAKSAALRSSDLSRQVGAAIFTPESEILSLGSNEVPRAFGGTYWAEEKYDARDFKLGYDSNQKRKTELLDEVLEELDVSDDKMEGVVKKLSLMDALEYGRIVHAEMSALMDAARVGTPVRGAVLFTTTFPCHMCAKHIVASGVKEVFFLEPYPKSLASRLHSDSIAIEKGDRGRYSDYNGVSFTHFFGVTPRRYSELFQRQSRKENDGKFLEYTNGKKRPLVDIKFAAYAHLEKELLLLLREVLSEERGVDNGG